MRKICQIFCSLSYQQFSTLQVLTQERHKYKLKFESKETEFDSMVREFQGEVGVAEQALQQQQQQSEQGDRSRSQIVQELTRQNERLTEQLRKVGLSQYFKNNDIRKVDTTIQK